LLAHFFFVLNNIPFSGYISVFIHSPTKEYLDCFQVLSVMNKAIININVQGFFIDTTFQLLWIIPKGVIAGLYGKVMLSFLREWHSGYTKHFAPRQQ